MTSPSRGRRDRGDLEAEVLAILARAETSLTSGEVAQRLERPLAYTTVMTVLSRLHDKGAVSRVRNGRAYAYSFQRDEAARRAAQMHRLLDAGEDRARVLAQFVGELGQEDEALLQRLLRETGG
ncbi:BlaI/MecI/CopY family transcriptional regulator [Streptosporangium subroseum]|uniref:BlaI/MecI/CopY family transcriptional regulator n=1 Tax=Streptosporangium subroseum TaxID=106412 RepID=UPI00342C0664